jgi:DNA-binding response OmpR family regulator
MHILIIEDDKKVAAFIQKGLRQEYHAVDVVHDGEAGLDAVESGSYDLVILDLMLPKISGLEILKRIRADKKQHLPVLVLTAKGNIEDRVEGLDSGADDYLVKPFSFAELSARVRALLRRGGQEETMLRVADLEIDSAARIVRRSGKRIDLTPKEYALLEFLLRQAGKAVSRNMILDRVWDIQFDGVSNVVDVHINWLRNKIDKEFSKPLIHTIRGVGYLLSDRDS